MARLNNEKPDPRIAVVRPDNENENYLEVYLMKPVLVGSITRIGPYNYGTTDGSTGFRTVGDATKHLLTLKGEHDVAADAHNYMTVRRGLRKPPTTTPVSGADLLRAGKWGEYCAAYGHDPGAVKPQALYPITLEERAKWGIK